MAKYEECKSTLVSKNITVLGKRTSIRLEPEMWRGLKEISERENCKIHDICSIVALRKNPNTSLTAAIRVFLMLYFRAATTEEGHKKAKHGDFMNMVKRARLAGNAGGGGADKQQADSSASLAIPAMTRKSADAIEQVASYF